MSTANLPRIDFSTSPFILCITTAPKEQEKRIKTLEERAETLEGSLDTAVRDLESYKRSSSSKLRELDTTTFELSQRIARLQGTIAAGTRWGERKQQQFDIEAVPEEQYDILHAAGLSDKEIIVYYRTQKALGGKDITAAAKSVGEGVGAEEGEV